MKPLVSVIMPVFNAGAYLRPAVESMLAQTYAEWELILVDDGSTDGCMSTIDDLRDPRIRRMRQENSGKPVAMNRALPLAGGKYWAILDADDISYPRRLELQVQCLEANPDVAAVFCGHQLILGDRAVAPLFAAKTREECAADINTGSMPAHDPTAMYRTSMVSEFRYSEDLPVVEGLDFILRVGEARPLLVLGECLYGYRIIDTSVTRRDPSRRNALVLEVLRRLCARRGLSTALVDQRRSMMEGSPEDSDNGIASHFNLSVVDHVMAGRRLGAIRTGLACWWLHPTVPAYAKPFVYSLCPRWLMRHYRRRRTEQAKEYWASLASPS